jgi:NO-binding membrane sensor protein with MHYT domain
MNDYIAIAGFVTGATVGVKNYLSVFMKPDDPRYDTTAHLILLVLSVALVLAMRGIPTSGSDAVTTLLIGAAILTGGVGAHTMGVAGLTASGK